MIIIQYMTIGMDRIMGSNIHYVPTIQADNNQFGAGVYIGHMFTVDNHAVIGIRVDNDLCIDIIIGEKSPGKHVHTVCGGCEHPGIAVIGGSNVRFYI